MKNIQFPTSKLSKKADMKIRFRLFVFRLKQIDRIIVSTSALACLSVFLFGYMYILSSPTQDSSQMLVNNSVLLEEMREIKLKKQQIALKKKVYAKKAQKYQQYSMVRTSRMR